MDELLMKEKKKGEKLNQSITHSQQQKKLRHTQKKNTTHWKKLQNQKEKR